MVYCRVRWRTGVEHRSRRGDVDFLGWQDVELFIPSTVRATCERIVFSPIRLRVFHPPSTLDVTSCP